VEFALLALPILVFTYGLMAMGFVLFEQITASQLAREAARSAAICQANPSGPSPSACAATRFNLNRPPGFDGVLIPPSVNCGPGQIGVSAEVSVAPKLPIPGLTEIRGKASTPCGG
jgi:Flp pilus assembly protein TadG